MTRTDTLKDNSDAGCEPNRQITKKCNRNKGAKGGKDKGRIFKNIFPHLENSRSHLRNGNTGQWITTGNNEDTTGWNGHLSGWNRYITGQNGYITGWYEDNLLWKK